VDVEVDEVFWRCGGSGHGGLEKQRATRGGVFFNR
jgi:hypothetical protein